MGCANSDPVLTPNMDAFASESVYCTDAVSAFPLCSPHRASLLTGRYPLHTGFFTNCKTGLSMRLKDDELCIGEVLRQAGYATGYIGKWHLDEPEQNRETKPASGAKNWDAYTPPGVRRHGFDYWYSYGAWDEHLSPHYWKDTPEQIHVDKWSPEHETDIALQYLEERDKDRPFALFVSWNPPHSPYDQVPDRYLDLYRHAELPLKENVDLTNIHYHTHEPAGYDRDTLMQLTREYYAAVSGLDDQFGRILEAIRNQGLTEDTIIVLTADHGDMMGSHGLMAKHVWYEESIGIPLVIGGGGLQPGICRTCIGSQDMMPTLLGLLNLQIPDTVEGKNCAPYIRKEEAETKDSSSFLCACPGREVFLEAFRKAGKHPWAYGWRGIRTRRYTYIIEAGYEPQPDWKRYLYDLEEDPLEMHPLILEDAQENETALELEKKVIAWMQEQEDEFLDTMKHTRALQQAVEILEADLCRFTDFFPSSNSFGGFYRQTENVEWTTGFWTGSLWLAYEYTGKECFRQAALKQADSFLERIETKTDVNHHDMGFLFSLSCVAAYKLTGSETGKKAALMAADHLAERYRETGQFLQAWGNVGQASEYRLIIDCLLNLPLLYWASEVTGDPSYAQKAENHIRTAMKCVLRPDNSTYHTHFIDMETGKPTYGVTHQGNRNGSAWARGQAWGVYGIALSYRYRKDPSYFDLFYRVTDYFLDHLPEDLIPYWDFDFTTGSEEPRDSSAAAIAVCGMLEMCNYLPDEKAEKYRAAAYRLMEALEERCANRDLTRSDGLLLHGTYARASAENTCRDRGVDECNTWGDYFYMEALTRIHQKDWNLYW